MSESIHQSPNFMFYVLKDGKQYGPYSETELRGYVATGSLLRTDGVWYQGATAWAPIESILRFSSPPPPPAHGNPYVVQVAAPNHSSLLIYESRKKSGWLAAFLNLFIPGLGFMYAGMPITGVFVFCLFLLSIITIIGPLILIPLIFYGGFLAAGKANRKLAANLSTLSFIVSLLMLFTGRSIADSGPETWLTSDGHLYRDVKIMKVDPDAVSVMYSDGVALIELSKLPADLQKRFNYDPVKAQAAAKQRAEDDEASQKAIDSEQNQQSPAPQQQLEQQNALQRVAFWSGKVQQNAQSAVTRQDRVDVMHQQLCLQYLTLLLKGQRADKSNDASLKNYGFTADIWNSALSVLESSTDEQKDKWVDAVMSKQIYIGMPKFLVIASWGPPQTDTVSSSVLGTVEMLTFHNYYSIVSISDGVVESVTTSQ